MYRLIFVRVAEASFGKSAVRFFWHDEIAVVVTFIIDRWVLAVVRQGLFHSRPFC